METMDPKTKIGDFIKSRILRYELQILVLIILILLLRIFNIPFTGMIGTLVLMSISVIYFFSAFAVTEDSELTAIDNFIYKLTAIASSVVIIGILFLIQHWPNGKMMITIGLLSLIASLSYIVYQKIRRPEEEKFNNLILLRIIILGIISAGVLYFGI